MKRLVLLPLLLAGCGGNADRLTDEQARVEQNAVIDSPTAIDPPTTPAASPKPIDQVYKAIGTEPGWALTVTPTTMRYEGDYGAVVIDEATPATFRPRPGRYAGARIQVAISPGPCSDGMSDLIYRHTVRLTADGKAASGCGGGTAPPSTLAGTSWTVIAINGRATPGGQNYVLSFDARQVSAKFGCNGIGGGYRINGDHLSTSGLTQTEMACAEPAMSFERQGSAVLSSNMRVERPSGTAMRLVSEAGSIDLRRNI